MHTGRTFLVPTGCTTVVVTLVWPAVASTMGGCVAAGASCFAVTTGAPGCTRAVELHDVPMMQGPTTRVRQRGGALGARVGVRATTNGYTRGSGEPGKPRSVSPTSRYARAGFTAAADRRLVAECCRTHTRIPASLTPERLSRDARFRATPPVRTD